MSSTLMNLSADEINTLRTNWGWSLALGILVTITGAAAMIHSVAATFVSLTALAWLMILAGIALAVHGIRTRKWSGFLLDLLGAAMIITAAIVLLRNPVSGVLAVTMMLAAYFIVSGIGETFGGFAGRYRSTGWALFDGVISLILGGILLASWPVSGLWFLGFAVGIKLFFLGCGLSGLAMSAHSLDVERADDTETKRAA